MRVSGKLERKNSEQEPKEPKAKYFIVPEGDNTENIYFCGIANNKKYLKIRPLIEIIPIENDETEKGHSHPKKKIDNFNKYLKKNKDNYIFDKKIDKVYFVIDRDPQNLKSKQLDEFIKECEKHKYEICLSNPTFEVFLLMHNNKVLRLNRKKMLKNKKVSKKRRFLERELSSIFGCSKENLRFEAFKDNILNAIKNEKHFCEDLKELKTKLGSNVGKLIESMIEK